MYVHNILQKCPLCLYQNSLTVRKRVSLNDGRFGGGAASEGRRQEAYDIWADDRSIDRYQSIPSCLSSYY